MAKITGLGEEADSVRRMLDALEPKLAFPANTNHIELLEGPPIGAAYEEARRDLEWFNANQVYAADAYDIGEQVHECISDVQGFQPDLSEVRVSSSLSDVCARLHNSTPFQWKRFAGRYWNLANEYTYYIERINLLLPK